MKCGDKGHVTATGAPCGQTIGASAARVPLALTKRRSAALAGPQGRHRKQDAHGLAGVVPDPRVHRRGEPSWPSPASWPGWR